MKATRISMIIAAFFAVMFCAVPGQAQFEGKIDYVISADGKDMNVSYSSKGDNMRFDLLKGIGPIPSGMSAIINMEDKQAILLMKSQKIAMIVPIDGLAEMAGQQKAVKKKVKESEEAKITKTGKTKSIAGYSCEQWVMTSKKQKKGDESLEVWTAKELGGISFISELVKDSPEWMSKFEDALGKNGGLPLLIIAKDDKGKETIHLEATNVSKNDVTDAMFQAPSGYQIIDQSKIQVDSEPDEQ